ncbi:MAG: hypothetical protein LUH58_11815 [Lachnospiraceae bacterium]|nr:hypothetical protein [Lachnospiraceae bacterium]
MRDLRSKRENTKESTMNENVEPGTNGEKKTDEASLQKRSGLHFLTFVIVLLWDEILLRIFTETEVLAYLLFPVLSSIVLGLFLGALTSFFSEKISRRLTILILTVISVFFTVECIVRRTYQTYMTVSSMLAGGGNVLGEFRSDLITAVINSLCVILLFLLPVFSYILSGKKIAPAK